MLDCSQLTWEQMSDLVRAVWLETKRRNPLGVNAYQPMFQTTIDALDEIDEAERNNPTSEAGPA